MDRIKGFTINQITLKGFKSFKDETVISCSQITKIKGHNGQGKSSIADAIAFAFTGTAFFGEARLDRLYTQGTKSTEVILDITDSSGVKHTLARQRLNDKTSISLDGVIITQARLNGIFTEKDIFLSMLNPMYFINVLGEKGKKLLYGLLPFVPQEKILASMNKDEQEMLKELNILSPDAYMKKLREEIAELKNDITYFEGQRDGASLQERSSNIIRLNANEETQSLRERTDALKAKQFDGIDVQKYQSFLDELTVKYDLAVSNPPQLNSEYDGKLGNLQKQLAETNCKAFVSEQSAEITELNAEIKVLLEKYKEQNEIMTDGIKAGKDCPYCARPVTDNDAAAIRAKISEKLSAIKADGSKLRAKLKDLEKAEIEAKDKFEKEKDTEIKRLTAEIRKAEEEKDAAQSKALEAYREEINKLEHRIEVGKLTLKQGNLSDDEYEMLCELEKQLIAAEAKEEFASEAPSEKRDYGKLIADCESKIEDKNKLMRCLEAYALKRAELTFSAVRMNKAEIKLYDVVKTTGEVKEAFRFTYDGIPYNCLSLSETIRAGAEVCELIKRITGLKYPTFYDNMESVAEMKNVQPTGQAFLSSFVKNTALTVNGEEIAPLLDRAA